MSARPRATIGPWPTTVGNENAERLVAARRRRRKRPREGRSRETRFRIGAQTVENRAPCRFIVSRVTFVYRDRKLSFGFPFFFISVKRNWILSTRRHIGEFDECGIEFATRDCARKLLENVTYSRLKEGRRGGREESDANQVAGVHRAFGPLRHPSGTNSPSPSSFCALCQRRNWSRRRLVLARSVSNVSVLVRRDSRFLWVSNMVGFSLVIR